MLYEYVSFNICNSDVNYTVYRMCKHLSVTFISLHVDNINETTVFSNNDRAINSVLNLTILRIENEYTLPY